MVCTTDANPHVLPFEMKSTRLSSSITGELLQRDGLLVYINVLHDFKILIVDNEFEDFC